LADLDDVKKRTGLKDKIKLFFLPLDENTLILYFGHAEAKPEN
jgi:hypothetical protein